MNNLARKRFYVGFVFVILTVFCIMMLVACGGNTEVGYKLRFDVDGEIVHSINTTDAELTLPTEPTKDGYVFDGWYFDKGEWSDPLSKYHF